LLIVVKSIINYFLNFLFTIVHWKKCINDLRIFLTFILNRVPLRKQIIWVFFHWSLINKMQHQNIIKLKLEPYLLLWVKWKYWLIVNFYVFLCIPLSIIRWIFAFIIAFNQYEIRAGADAAGPYDFISNKLHHISINLRISFLVRYCGNRRIWFLH
jgi:hypothetical protein